MKMRAYVGTSLLVPVNGEHLKREYVPRPALRDLPARNARFLLKLAKRDDRKIPFAIGVPTVVDSATLAADILEESGVEKVDEERLRGEHDAFMVTTRDIDQQVRDLSKVVGYGINWALQDLEIEEMNALLS